MKDVIALLNTRRAELLDGIARIDAAISALGGDPGRSSALARPTGTRKRRKRSEQEKQAASERMKNYWAERRKQAQARANGTAGDETREANGG